MRVFNSQKALKLLNEDAANRPAQEPASLPSLAAEVLDLTGSPAASSVAAAQAIERIRELLQTADILAKQALPAGAASDSPSAAGTSDSDLAARAQCLQKLIETALHEASPQLSEEDFSTIAPRVEVPSEARLDLEARTREGVSQGSFRLYGPLQKLSTMEVLEFTRSTRKTGCIAVEDGEFKGLLHVLNGEAVYAEAGDLRGFEAFCDILQVTEGKVEFHSIPVSVETRNLHGPTVQLIFRGLQTLDERNCEMRR